MLPNLTLATRIAEWNNPVDVGSAVTVGSEFIHSELIFNNLELKYDSFSSRSRVQNVKIKNLRKRHDKKGVHFAKVNFTKGKWLYTTIPVTIHQMVLVYNRAQDIVGKEYGKPGAVFGCGFGFPVDHSYEYWSSEAVAYALKRELFFLSVNLTPHQLLLEVQSFGRSKSRTILKNI